MLDIVILDGAEVDAETGAPLVKTSQPATGDSDVETYGNVPLMQCLGVSAFPYGADADGAVEGVIAVDVGGRDGVCVGGRDTRSAKIVGNLKPGDTVVHSTGPEQAAQLQLKESKRQAVLVSRGTDGKQIMISIDGNGDKLTIAAFGGVFEMTPDTISMYSKNGKNGLIISDEIIHVRGTVQLGGDVPIPAASIMLGPVAGSPGGGAAAPMIAAKGVFVGL